MRISLLLTFCLFTGSLYAQCISNWSELNKISSAVKGLNLDQIRQKGAVSFKVEGKSDPFTLQNRNNQIFARTPEGNAAVQLCAEGGGLKAVANILGFRKEARIRSLGSGSFQINTNSNVHKASVVR